MTSALALVPTVGQAEITTKEKITDIKDAWVRLYDDKGCGDTILEIHYDTTYSAMKGKKWKGGVFNDKASSVRYQIPVGWKAVLFEHSRFRGYPYELKGTGKVVEIYDLGPFSDKTSSIRWERGPQ